MLLRNPTGARRQSRVPGTYELYVQRGNQSGSELHDWLQAEEEILRAQEEVMDES